MVESKPPAIAELGCIRCQRHSTQFAVPMQKGDPLYNALFELDVDRQRGPEPQPFTITKGDPLYNALVRLDVNG